MTIEKHYVWLWAKNPYAKEMNNQPEKELRRYRVKEFKEKCVILFDGRQFPYSQIVKIELVNHKVNHKAESEDKIMTRQEDYGKIKELYKQGYSIKGIAEKLDMPELTVKTFLWCELIDELDELPNSTTVVKRDRNTGKITITRYDNTDDEGE